MPIARVLALLAAAVLLAGCSASGGSGLADRRANPEARATGPTVLPSFSVNEVRVVVPRSLTVSEANAYYPRADIVWRGDPPGDRYTQVTEIVRDGLTRGAGRVRGARPVNVDVTVNEFHALTEKARYTVGGWHVIRFTMVLTDPQTGVPLTVPRRVNATLEAFGGEEALAAERQGITQRARIEAHLAQVIQQELARPFVAASAPPSG